MLKEQAKKVFLLLIMYIFVVPAFAGTQGDSDYLQYLRTHLRMYLPISGGYGYVKDAQFQTAFSGLLRVGIGSRLSLHEKIQLGTEIGFQTGTQILMNQISTQILGDNALPVTLTVKPLVDLLLTAKFNVLDPAFIQLKGGAAYVNTMVSGADVMTSQTWMPDAQAGIGVNLSSKVAFVVNYQGFYGNLPQLSLVNASEGVFELRHIPTWQAIIMTVEIKI